MCTMIPFIFIQSVLTIYLLPSPLRYIILSEGDIMNIISDLGIRDIALYFLPLKRKGTF